MNGMQILCIVFFTDNVWLCSGYINEDRLRDLLITMGDRFTDEEVGARHLQISNITIVKKRRFFHRRKEGLC